MLVLKQMIVRALLFVERPLLIAPIDSSRAVREFQCTRISQVHCNIRCKYGNLERVRKYRRSPGALVNKKYDSNGKDDIPSMQLRQPRDVFSISPI